MHPDRRRAGRAIRKARREERERFVQLTKSFRFLGRGLVPTLRALAEGFAAFGAAMRGASDATRRHSSYAGGPLAISGPHVQSPTEGGQGVYGAHSGSRGGYEIPGFWVDEHLELKDRSQ